MTTLNEIMEFDHVVFVDEFGHVHDHDTLTPMRAGWSASASASRGVNESTRLYAPELCDDLDGDPVLRDDGTWDSPERDVKADSRALQHQARAYGWDGLLEGFTGQYGYRGPIMHESEYIGGGLATYILENPGWYVAVAVNAPDNDGTYSGEVAGWAIAYKEASETDGPWVDVVFADGDDFNVMGDMGIGEMASHLEQWDYGQETDDAHTRDSYPWGSSDRVYKVGQYTLAINYGLGYASLNRRPMGAVVTA